MNKLIKLPEVTKLTTLSKSSIYAFISDGTFPKQISIGSRGSAWLLSDVEEWIDKKVSESAQAA
ncbi:MAG: AlpA family transcriptional regulator [Colwellia sp.]|nr:AlpA family transcriptional regulator [Colwellia sp.]